MLRGYRSFILAVVGVLIGSALIWAYLKPPYPSLPTEEYQKAADGKYSPGSPACYPSRLDSLSKREASDERYRCEQGAEEHRLKSDDLVQQTRAADAAYVMAGLSYNQSLMMLAGTILGLLTLVSAFAAVLYAKRAATAAEESQRDQRRVTNAQIRAHVFITKMRLVLKKGEWLVRTTMTNQGSLITRDLDVILEVGFLPLPLPKERGPLNRTETTYSFVRPGGKYHFTRSSYVTAEQFQAVQESKGVLWVRAKIRYTPSPESEPESFEIERVFVAFDIEDRSPRHLSAWMFETDG